MQGQCARGQGARLTLVYLVAAKMSSKLRFSVWPSASGQFESS